MDLLGSSELQASKASPTLREAFDDPRLRPTRSLASSSGAVSFIVRYVGLQSAGGEKPRYKDFTRSEALPATLYLPAHAVSEAKCSDEANKANHLNDQARLAFVVRETPFCCL